MRAQRAGALAAALLLVAAAQRAGAQSFANQLAADLAGPPNRYNDKASAAAARRRSPELSAFPQPKRADAPSNGASSAANVAVVGASSNYDDFVQGWVGCGTRGRPAPGLWA